MCFEALVNDPKKYGPHFFCITVIPMSRGKDGKIQLTL